MESAGKASALMTVSVKAADYADSLEKSLKACRRKAQMKGFRPGCVPMSIVKRLYGPSLKAEEVSKAVDKAVGDYLDEHKTGILGHILENEGQKPQDYVNGEDFEFLFDIALAPVFTIELTAEDRLPYYDIVVSDELVSRRTDEIALARGRFEQADSYAEGGYIKGDLAELSPAEGEEPLKVSGAVVSPEYVSDEEQRKLLAGARKGGTLTVVPAKMYGSGAQLASMLKVKPEEAARHTGAFAYTVTEINRRVPAALDQELFDSVLGKGQAASEEEFRAKIRGGMEAANLTNSDYKFLMDLQDYALDKAGGMEFSEPLLKRLMKENNPDKDDKFIDDSYPAAIRGLKWREVKSRLAVQAGVKVGDDDVREAARRAAREQFAQYGMTLPGDVIEKYARESLAKKEQVDRFVDEVIDAKLISAYKGIVTLERKSVTPDEFNGLLTVK